MRHIAEFLAQIGLDARMPHEGKQMTHDQISLVLESLRVGVNLEAAQRAARVKPSEWQEAVASDQELTDLVEEAYSEGLRSQHVQQPIKAKMQTEARRRTQEAAELEAEEATERSSGKGKRGKAPSKKLAREEVAEAAEEFAPGMFGYLMWLNYRCVAVGMPDMSDWWRTQLGLFYASGKRWGLFRVGRGGGKSTTLTRVSAAEGMFGARKIPPGQRWIWPFISVSTEDATRRIFEIAAILRAIGLDANIRGPTYRRVIELDDVDGQAIAWLSLASTIAGVSGPSTIGATIDEEAKLRDKSINANPATEILASLLQTFRARGGIRAIRCSSAWNEEGSHAQAIAAGETEMNFVARIGDEFLPIALAGLDEVARWEESTVDIDPMTSQPCGSKVADKEAASRIRSYALTVTAASPNVPTWVANPTISAIACRRELNAMTIQQLDGMSRAHYWLRENASLPMGGPGATMTTETLEWYRRLNNRPNDIAPPTFDGIRRSSPGPRGLITGSANLPDGDPRSPRRGRSGSGGRGIAF